MAKMNVVVLQCLVVALLLAYGEGKKDRGLYVLKKGDFTLNFTNYGATMLSVIVPDRNGNLADVILGYDTFEQYEKGKTYFGGLIGRVANRIGKAEFTLNGVQYELSKNDGNNTLHGGTKGFNKVIWDVHSYEPDSHVTFTYNSYDGEEGFPGAVSVSVTYIIMEKNMLGVKMEATPLKKATPINLALHTYWNLAGQNSGDILSHDIQIFGSKITPVDDELIPTGEIRDIRGSPYDFLQPRKIGGRINELPNGYDINYALDGVEGPHLRKVALVHDSKTGRKMELWSNQVGVQFYTSGMVHDEPGKGAFVYKQHAGLCLETQGFPDSVDYPYFPSQIVNPGHTYKHVMLYRFTAA